MVTDQVSQGSLPGSPRACGLARKLRLAGPWFTMAAAAWLGACWGDSVAPEEGLPAAVISNPIPTAAARGAGIGPADGLAAAQVELVYVSLAPDSFPDGRLAVIGNPRTGTTVSDSMVNGGLDPVPVAATGGDTVTVDVLGSAGPVAHLGFPVPEARKPRVVRVSPVRRKRDVPLNARPVIFFTEPVAANSVTPSSVRLLRGDNPVAGSVRLLEGSGAVAAFVPTAALDPNTEYRVLVTQDVRDLEGESLEASYTSSFTTGQSVAGPPARIRLSPDTVLITGLVYQMSAFVEDDDGNILIDEPITWSTTDEEGLAVSATGRLYALVDGSYSVFARSGQLEASAWVIVRATAGSVIVLPQAATVAATDTVILTATVRDVDGRLLQREVSWTSSDNTIATVTPAAVDSTGLSIVGGVNPGTATITATSGLISGTAVITVTPARPVASVTVPSTMDVLIDSTVRLATSVRDTDGRLILRRLTWTSDNAAVATVDSTGLVTGVSAGFASVVATSEGVSDTAAIGVTAALSFAAVTGKGLFHTCALQPYGRAWCWGISQDGRLGDGSANSSVVPVAVAGGQAFAALSAGVHHTCGLSTAGVAYCWGSNYYGQLGTGSEINSNAPSAVVGGRTFITVSSGLFHTCGVTSGGTAYCWGSNLYGQLGDGSTASSNVPVAVAGGLRFSSVSAGFFHTCGIAVGGSAYCWGRDIGGSLGNGAGGPSSFPVAVEGGLTFTSLSASSLHTCGVASDSRAYCWGAGGALGTGTTDSSASPVPVISAGDELRFSSVSAGSGHTCGVAAGGVAYCWGWNYYGQLGDGSTTPRMSPVPVSGGLTFTMIQAAADRSCGVTTDRVAYCWGENHVGQLGNGTTTLSTVPVKVAGQP